MEAEQAVLSYKIASEVGSQPASEQQFDIGNAKQKAIASKEDNVIKDITSIINNSPMKQQDVPVQSQPSLISNPIQAMVKEKYYKSFIW